MTLGDVLANHFARYVVRTVSDFWSQDARGVGGEDGCVRCADCVVNGSGLVVVNCFVDLEGCEVATVLLGLCLVLATSSASRGLRVDTYWT